MLYCHAAGCTVYGSQLPDRNIAVCLSDSLHTVNNSEKGDACPLPADRLEEDGSGSGPSPLMLWSGFILLQAIHLVAAVAAPYSLWSAHHLRYTGIGVHVAWGILLLFTLVPVCRPYLVRGAELIVTFFSRGSAVTRLAAPLAAAVFFYFLRIDNPFLGDGSLLATLVSNPKPPDFGSAGFGSLWLHEMIYRGADRLFGNVSGEIPFVSTSVISGAISLYLAAHLARLIAPGTTGRAVVFTTIAASGGALFFFGYQEHYPLMHAALLAYLYFSIRHIRGENCLAAATAAIVAASLLHISALVLFPSWFLLLSRGTFPPLRRAKRLLLLLIPGAAAAFLLFRYSERFYGGLDAFVPLLRKGVHSYTLLSSHHFSFVTNELFLLMGGAFLLLLLNLPARIDDDDTNNPGSTGGLFLGVTSLCGVAFLFLVDPRLGPRDWDLMAIPLYPMLILAGFLCLSGRIDPPRSSAALVIAAVLLHTIPWVAANRERSGAVQMTLDMVIHDPHYANPEARAPKSLGVLLSRAGYHKEAGRLYELAVGTRTDAQNLFNLGTNFARQGEFESAVDHLVRALEIEPYYVEAYTNLAGALQELNRDDDAEKTLRELIRFDPENVRGQVMLGDLLNAQDRTDEAIRHYESALGVDSDNMGAWANLGVARAKGGDREGAGRAFRRALSLDPENARIREYLDRLGRAE